jgi:hypothetical protein
MKTILQIMFGPVPLHLEACVASVKRYTLENGFGHIVITEPDKFFKVPEFESKLTRFLWMRHASDWIRTRILSETPYTLYVDWDIFLYPDFGISDVERMAFGKNQCLDAILYNGNECKKFVKIHKQIEKPNIDDNYELSKALTAYSKDHAVGSFTGHYCHLDNCRFKDVLDYDNR